MSGCRIDGLDTSLDSFEEITDNDIKKALSEISNKAKKIMMGATAVKTGKAKKSVKSSIKRYSGGFKSVTRFTEDYYGYQEFESDKSSPENIGKVYRALKGIDEEAMKILEKLAIKRSGM